MAGPLAPLFRNDQAWEGGVVEAPFLWKHSGRYYLFYSGNGFGTGQYAIGYAVSDAVAGRTTAGCSPTLHISWHVASSFARPSHTLAHAKLATSKMPIPPQVHIWYIWLPIWPWRCPRPCLNLCSAVFIFHLNLDLLFGLPTELLYIHRFSPEACFWNAGPYTKCKQPIVSTRGKVVGPGACCLIKGPNSTTWMLYHHWDPTHSHRPTSLAQLHWDGDKPVVTTTLGTPCNCPFSDTVDVESTTGHSLPYPHSEH